MLPQVFSSQVPKAISFPYSVYQHSISFQMLMIIANHYYIHMYVYVHGYPHIYNRLFTFCFAYLLLWKRKWQHTPVLLPGKSYGQRSLVGNSPWGHKSQTQLSD